MADRIYTKRQTQMKMIDSVKENYEAEGFHGPMRRRTVLPKNKQDAWLGIHATERILSTINKK